MTAGEKGNVRPLPVMARLVGATFRGTVLIQVFRTSGPTRQLR